MGIESVTSSPPAAVEKTPEPSSQGLYRWLATSPAPFPTLVRNFRRSVFTFSAPAPRLIVVPMLWLYLVARNSWAFARRVLFCEPLFKAYCKSYGKRLRTGDQLHWVEGKGDIVLGDNVWLDGKIDFAFAARFADRPLLEIGSNTAIGHGCRIVIGKRITIGRNCTISGGTIIMESNGHRSDAAARIQGLPPSDEEVRPIVIGDNVWIGMHCIIFPGVRIGQGSVISAGSIVRTHLPPYCVAAGNPARVMFRLKKPDASTGDKS